MTRARDRKAAASGAEIDARYGLEPVFDPAARADDAGLDEFLVVACPYCGESYQTAIDLTAGSATFIEDCQICCQPIEIELCLTDGGAVQSFAARRLD